MALNPTCWIPRASPSPLAETVDGEALWCPSLRPFSCSLLPGLGSLPPRTAALSLLLWPPPCRVFPDDAPPDCVLRYIQNRSRGTDVPILWLFLENRGNDFLNPTLSGEQRNPSLLRPQAPACPPCWGSSDGCQSMQPLSVRLAPLKGPCGEAGGWKENSYAPLAPALEKEMATHSNIHAWRIAWTEEPGRLQSMGLQIIGHD